MRLRPNQGFPLGLGLQCEPLTIFARTILRRLTKNAASLEDSVSSGIACCFDMLVNLDNRHMGGWDVLFTEVG